MHGAAVSLAKKVKSHPSTPDLFLVSDMLDLSVFIALCGPRYAHIPTLLYFHENQLSYPWSPTDEDTIYKRDRHYAFINYTSAMVADRVCFNSAFHMDSFLSELPSFLSAFPDHQEVENVDIIRAKSQVLPLGVEFGEQKAHIQQTLSKPTILWNHRWEYDKNPSAFFRLLTRISQEGIDFSLILLGESFQKIPPAIQTGLEVLKDHIIHQGFVESRSAYQRWVWQADVLPVTSRHDFFGLSVVEATGAGVYPLLPNRCAYPEHIPAEWQSEHIYTTEEELYLKLTRFLRSPKAPHPQLQGHVHAYKWQMLKGRYDALFQQIAANAGE